MDPASSPTLSVIIVSFNTRDFLAGCLNSLRRVSDEAEMEVIVVDNGSSDGSPEMVKEKFPEVVLVQAGKNVGFAAANNLGLARANGKFLFFLNPDAIVSRGTLVQLVRFFDAPPLFPPLKQGEKIAVAGAQLVCPDGRPQLSVLEFPNLWREFWNFLPEIKGLLVSVKRGLISVIPFSAKQNLEPRRVGAVSGAAMMVRADTMREVGGFDEGFFLYHEERDLCYRIAAKGWETWTVPGAKVIHYDARSSGYRTDKFPREPILSYRILGMDRLYRKHRHGWQHGVWNLRARIMLRAREWGRMLKGDKKGAGEIAVVVQKLRAKC